MIYSQLGCFKFIQIGCSESRTLTICAQLHRCGFYVVCCVVVFLGFFFKQDTYMKRSYFLQTSLPCKMAARLDGCQPFMFNHWCRVLARATSVILVQLGPSWLPPPPWPPPTTTTTRTTTAKTKANNIINYHNQWSFQQGNVQEQHMFSPLLSVWIISMFVFKYPLHQLFCPFPPSYVYPFSNHLIVFITFFVIMPVNIKLLTLCLHRHPQPKILLSPSLRQAIMCQRTTLRLL